MPLRIQRKRVKGWRMPANTVYVGRPTKWGNTFTVQDYGRDRSVKLFRQDIECRLKLYPNYLKPLREKNLACWCALNELCHADVLLELANKKPAGGQSPQPSLKRGS